MLLWLSIFAKPKWKMIIFSFLLCYSGFSFLVLGEGEGERKKLALLIGIRNFPVLIFWKIPGIFFFFLDFDFANFWKFWIHLGFSRFCLGYAGFFVENSRNPQILFLDFLKNSFHEFSQITVFFLSSMIFNKKMDEN